MTAEPRVPDGTIDAHVHLGPDSYGLADAYEPTMARLGIAGAVLVQRRWQFDNAYLLGCRARAPSRFAVVGAVDVVAPDADVALRRLMSAGAAGIRIDPVWLIDNPTAALWTAAAETRALVSVAPDFAVIASEPFRRAMKRHAEVMFRLEHLAGIEHGTTARHVAAGVLKELALHPNVVAQVSGFWLNAGGPRPYATAVASVRAAFDAFGPGRLVWSGDWNRPPPPVGRHISDDEYAAEADLLAEPFGITDAGDRAQILGGTAARLFGLAPGPA